MFEVLGVEVHILSIIFAVIVNIVVGMLWFSPIMFGKYWQKLVNKTDADLQMKPLDMILSIIIALLMATGLNSVLQFSLIVSQLNEIVNIFATAGMITATFIIPPLMNGVIWEGRSYKLLAINVSHLFVTLVLMGAVLSIWI